MTFMKRKQFPFTGTDEPNKLTCSQLSGFIDQLTRALHQHRRGHGFESRWRRQKFFSCTYKTIILLHLSSKSEDHFFNVFSLLAILPTSYFANVNWSICWVSLLTSRTQFPSSSTANLIGPNKLSYFNTSILLANDDDSNSMSKI